MFKTYSYDLDKRLNQISSRKLAMMDNIHNLCILFKISDEERTQCVNEVVQHSDNIKLMELQKSKFDEDISKFSIELDNIIPKLKERHNITKESVYNLISGKREGTKTYTIESLYKSGLINNDDFEYLKMRLWNERNPVKHDMGIAKR